MDPRTSSNTRSHGMPWLRDDRYSFLLAGMMWVLIVLMIVPDGFDYQSLTTTGAPSSGGVISRVLWLGLLALSVIIICWRAGWRGCWRTS